MSEDASTPRYTDRYDFAAALAEAARTINQPRTVEETLEAITETTRRSIPDFDAVGISLVHADGTIETKAATGDLVWKLDGLQYELREGPCVSSLSEEPVIIVDHLRHEQRWPRFVPEAVKLGLRAQMALRLYVDEHAQEVDNLNQALRSRQQIGTAVGILIERYDLDEQGAFSFLTRLSSHSNVKLRDVAARLVEDAVKERREVT